MIEFKGKIEGFLRERGTVLIGVPETYLPALEELFNADVDVKISKHREKRSLDANSYFWVLLDQLAEKIGESKAEIYKSYIRNIGGVSDTICLKEKAVEDFCKGWQKNGLGWQTEVVDSKLKGCKNVIVYYGSSTFDSAQFSRLLDMLIQDCNAVGVPTATEKEINQMIERWGDV
jgi:hypothetical protein